MSEKRKVLSYKSLPARSPLFSSIVLWMMLDYYKAPGWVWGVVGTCVILWAAAWLIEVFSADHIDLEDLL